MIRIGIPIGVLLLASCFIPADGADGPQAPPPRPVLSTAELVQQLSSEDFQEREEATRRLAALDADKPPPELIEAAKSDNPDLRGRAAKAVEAIRWRAAGRHLEHDRKFADRGAIDLFVASSAAWDVKADDSRVWESVLDISKELFKKANKFPPNQCPAAFKDLAAFRKACHPRFIKTDTLYRRGEEKSETGGIRTHYQGGILAPEVDDPWALTMNIIVARGNVRADACINSCIVFANGNVAVGTYFSGSVIVCDGDVETRDRVLSCLIIARGNIKARGTVAMSTLISGGKVTVKEVATDEIGKPIIKENVAKPLDFVTFFELSAVGVEVKVADKAVQVSTVAKGKAFAKADVQVGDIIVEVNGKKPTDTESLRRLLRDALAVGDATVKLQRSDKTETVKVALPE
jgi:PDZ domain